MSKKNNFCIIGGDMRQIFLYKSLIKDGNRAKIYGFCEKKVGFNIKFEKNIDTALKEILIKHGISVLSNENKLIKVRGKKLYISGVEDSFSAEPDIDKALKHIGLNVIVLTHSPDIFPKVPDSVFLTLAGHTHGGQVHLPFYGALFIPSEFGKRYSDGLIIEGKKKMIVTRGIGTSTIHIRFNCPPEIIVIDFEW